MRSSVALFTLSSLALTLFSCGGQSSSSVSVSSQEVSSVDPAPNIVQNYVRAEGTKLIGDDGKEILLRGTNLGGVFIQERWMDLTDSPDLLYTVNTLNERFGRDEALELLDIFSENAFNSEDFANLKALGINCIRLPISYLDVYDCDYDLLRSDNPDPQDVLEMEMWVRFDHLKKIDELIYEAERNGMYVVLDLHGAFGSQNGNDHSIDSRQHDWLWRKDALGEAFRELTQECWELLAERYKGFKNIVGYDLLNEPAGDNGDPECVTSVTYELQWNYFDVLYDAIRAIDPNHIIIMESCWEASNLPQPERYGWENVMYEFHHYVNDGIGDDEEQVKSFRNKIAGLKAAKFDVPLYMGEFCPHCSYQGWERILDLLNGSGINWTTWTYKVKRMGSEWGLYNIRTANEEGESLPVSETPRIARGSDSYEEIARKWGKAQRNGLVKNEDLCNAVSKFAKEAYPRNPN